MTTSVCAYESIFYGYDDTEFSYSEDDEINEGRGAIIRKQSVIN